MYILLMLICGLRNPTIRSRCWQATFVLTTKVKLKRRPEMKLQSRYGEEPNPEMETMGK